MNTDNSMVSVKRLYKSRRDKMIDGVCGGIAEYFQIDATVIRVLWVLSIFFGGTGIFLYILCMIIMPVNPQHLVSQTGEVQQTNDGGAGKFWGLLLIAIGIIILMSKVSWFPFYAAWYVSWGVLLPVILILLGMGLIYSHQQSRTRETEQVDAEPTQITPKKLYKSRFDRKIFGVCGGLGYYFNVDPTMIRILFVLITLLSVGVGLILYIAMAIFVPDEPVHTQNKNL